LVNDVHAFEVDPERMRGIGEAAMSECICLKQVAEFIMNARRWDAAKQRDRGIRGEGNAAANQHG
jgi:hypothetical protein